MLNKAFNSFSGFLAAATETPRGAAAATHSESGRKPSNLTVRAALKRKRMASSASVKSEPAKPA